MNITAKFIGSSALLVTFVALLSGSSYWMNQRAANSLEANYIQSQRAIAAISKLDATLQDEIASLNRLAVLPEKTTEIAYYSQQHSTFLATLNEFAQVVPKNDLILQAQLKTIRQQHKYLDTLLVRALERDLSERQVQGLIRSTKIFEDSLNIYIQALLKRSEEQAADYRMQAERFYIQVVWLEALSFGVIVLMLALQFRYFLRPAFQSHQSLQQEVCDRTAAEAQLKQTLDQLEQTQLQLLQTEKMSSLGQLVAGVAHEINNPVSFIQGNLAPAQDYVDSLIDLVRSYQTEFPQTSAGLQESVAQTDIDFIQADFPQLLNSMDKGANRITKIVRSLRTFSHLDESETKSTNLHEGLESTLLLLSSRLNATADRPEITIVRAYDQLPDVYCYPGQLNQVFMGILTNAIDAFTSEMSESSDATILHPAPTITLTTQAHPNHVRICISDNGPGMSEAVRAQIFDPFFTTKPVGSGMGLGLAMSYQIIVANHQGSIACESAPGKGSRFTVDIPLTLKIKVKPAITLAPDIAA